MTTRSTYTDPQTKEYWLRVRAALKFCDGYSTEQLEGRTLGDVLDVLRDAKNLIEGDARNMAMAFGVTEWRKTAPHSAEIVCRSNTILSHFRQEQPDDKDS